MKQEAWIKQLRDRLADHEEAAPADLWADIEAKLAEQAAPKRARVVPLWGRWAAAAAVFAGVIMGGGYLMHETENEQMAVSAGSGQMAEVQNTDETPNLSETEAIESTESGIVTKSQQFVAQLKQMASAVSGMVMPSATSEEQPVAVQDLPEEKQLAEVIEQKVEEQSDEQQTSQEKASKQTTTPKKQLPTEDDVIRELDRKIAMVSKQRHSHAGLGLYAANGFGNQMSSNGVVMNPAMAANYSMDNYRSSGTRSDGNDVIYLADFEEHQKHYQPISFGLTTNIPIYPRLSIATGVVYTRLRSDFTKEMSGVSFVTEQTLHYIGIPVNLQYQIWNFKLWEYGSLRIYGSAGGQADLNVKASLKSEGSNQSMDRDDLQFSVNGGIGVQFNFAPQVGIYVEPGIKYYFKNGSDVRNFFKDKPTNFNVQVGLRLNLGNQ